MSSRISKKTGILGGIGVASVLGLGAAILLTGASGATFTASGAGTATAKTATLSLTSSDAHGATDTFNLSYPNLAPGQTEKDTFTVTNTGSIAGDLVVGFAPPQGFAPGGADLSMLTAGVENYSALASVSPFTPVDLGVINAGQTKTFTMDVNLDQNAGNDWQGQTVTTAVNLSLTQQ